MLVSALPLELQARIIAYFDIHTIRNFLMAFPEFRRHAVLITDHKEAPNFFGNIDDDGPNRILAHKTRGGRHITFTRPKKVGCATLKNCFIKLVEITNYEMFAAWTDFIDRGVDPSRSAYYMSRKGWFPTLMDQRTFVFIHGYNASSTAMFKLLRAVMDNQKLNSWFMGLSTHPTSSPFRHISKYSDALLEPRHIVSLTVEGVVEFSGHHLPSLRHLMVDFTRIQETQSVKRGLIKDLTVPGLLTLVVHYRTHIPTFRNLLVCTEFTASGALFYHSLKRGDAIPHTQFELTDIDACLDCSFADNDLDLMEVEPDSDLSFIGAFTVLSFNCVEVDRIISDKYSTLKLLKELRLTVKHPKHYPSRAALPRLTGLHSFVLINLCDNWKPCFQDATTWVYLWEIQILSSAQGLDLSEVLGVGYLNRSAWDFLYGLARVCIHQSDIRSNNRLADSTPIASDDELMRLREWTSGRLTGVPVIEVSQSFRDTGLRSVLLELKGRVIGSFIERDHHWKPLRSLKNIDHSKLWP